MWLPIGGVDAQGNPIKAPYNEMEMMNQVREALSKKKAEAGPDKPEAWVQGGYL